MLLSSRWFCLIIWSNEKWLLEFYDKSQYWAWATTKWHWVQLLQNLLQFPDPVIQLNNYQMCARPSWRASEKLLLVCKIAKLPNQKVFLAYIQPSSRSLNIFLFDFDYMKVTMFQYKANPYASNVKILNQTCCSSRCSRALDFYFFATTTDFTVLHEVWQPSQVP